MIAPGADAGWRRNNLGHLLFVATGRSMAEALQVAQAAGFGRVTEAQLALFGHLDRRGTRLTELAARAGVAKQSSIELVDRAERAGLVMRTADPEDARAKIVLPTVKGERLMRLVRRGRATAGRLAAANVGAARLGALRRDLAAYTGRVASLDQLMAAGARAFVRDVLAAIHPHGYGQVTEALLALFRHLDVAGSRLTDVAVRAHVTKQSMQRLVERAEALGLVERPRDAADLRARSIRFTAPGRVMLERLRECVEAAEQSFVAATGADLAEVKSTLCLLVGEAHDAPATIGPGWSMANSAG